MPGVAVGERHRAPAARAAASAGRGLAIEGRPDPGPENQPGAGYSVACPNILQHARASRWSRDASSPIADALDAPGVALINETMARRFWPSEDAVGKRFKIGQFADDAPWLTVVGVFKDIRHCGLDAEHGSWFLRPYSQAGWPVMSIVVEDRVGASARSIEPVKQAIARRRAEPAGDRRADDGGRGRAHRCRRGASRCSC